MLATLKIQCEHNDCFEVIQVSGEAIKNMIKNEPNKLLKIIEDIEKRFPEQSKGKNDYKENDSFLMMAIAASTSF